MTHVFVGLMVLYRITAEEALATNKRREDARQNRENMRQERPGFQAHIGHGSVVGDRFPMVITQVFPNHSAVGQHEVNGQVFLDGSDSLWVTMIDEGDAPGQFEPIMDT